VTAPTHVPSMETHPDIVELRARYERASVTPVGQAIEAFAIVVGLYLAVSPWIIGFNGFTTLAVNNLVTGLAYALLIGGFGPAFESSHARGWAASLIGVWTIIAPWAIFGSPAVARSISSNVVTGVLALGLALAMCSLARAEVRGAMETATSQPERGGRRRGTAASSQPMTPGARPDYPPGATPEAGGRGPDMGGGPGRRL